MIDQDQPSRNYLASLLAKQKHEVQAVASGREGYIIAVRDRPDIIIIDASLADIPAIQLVRKLRSDKRSAGATCIALAAVSSTSQKEDMLAAGCNHFFLKSKESMDKLLLLLVDPARLKENGGQQKQRSRGLLGVFISAKGGLGTSSMCANITQNIATTHPELDVAVMDLVQPVGSIASITGRKGGFDLRAATALSPQELDGNLLRSMLPPLENWHFRSLEGSPDPQVAGALDQTRVLGVASTFRHVFDLTMIDLGLSLSGPNLPLIQEADVVVMVTNTDLATINLTKIVWQFLLQNGVKPPRMYVLINRSMGLEGLSKSDAERILGLEIRATAPHLGGTFALANNQHLPVMTKLPNDTATLLIKQISREILETARRTHA